MKGETNKEMKGEKKEKESTGTRQGERKDKEGGWVATRGERRRRGSEKLDTELKLTVPALLSTGLKSIDGFNVNN